MKRKICFMEYNNDVQAYVETHTTPVANHKGLPEIEKNARRECTKLQRVKPSARLAYIIINERGEAVIKKEYDNG